MSELPPMLKWLEWAQRLQSIAQAGLTYSPNPYDQERYAAIREIAAEILASHMQADFQVMLNLLTSQTGYATPKVDVRGVIFQDEKILLVRELNDDGKWTLPGGWADVGNLPSQAVEREVFEETGFQVRATKLLAVHDRNLHGHPPTLFPSYKLLFRCEILGGSPADNLETAQPTYFGENEIPQLSIERTTPEQIHRMFEHLRRPDLPTDFD